MIIDKLDNLGKYTMLNPLFADVVEFLKSHDLNTMEPGKYPIKDKDLFLNLTIAKGRGKEAATLETHIQMIDIQIPLSCEKPSAIRPLAICQASNTMQKRISRSMVRQWLRPT